jgi:hypothetical protein
LVPVGVPHEREILLLLVKKTNSEHGHSSSENLLKVLIHENVFVIKQFKIQGGDKFHGKIRKTL